MSHNLKNKPRNYQALYRIISTWYKEGGWQPAPSEIDSLNNCSVDPKVVCEYHLWKMGPFPVLWGSWDAHAGALLSVPIKGHDKLGCFGFNLSYFVEGLQHIFEGKIKLDGYDNRHDFVWGTDRNGWVVGKELKNYLNTCARPAFRNLTQSDPGMLPNLILRDIMHWSFKYAQGTPTVRQALARHRFTPAERRAGLYAVSREKEQPWSNWNFEEIELWLARDGDDEVDLPSEA